MSETTTYLRVEKNQRKMGHSQTASAATWRVLVVPREFLGYQMEIFGIIEMITVQ